jgi:5-formyltetrahydrofolate cyclo-ligase
MDMCLVPGLVFDHSGGRIGMGGGYYDRLLSQARDDCLFYGVAFSWQVLEEPLPQDPWDIRLHGVLTD